ncbi:MAG: GGDEF domain-containing protein [Lachnospiraceae bacterium]|nr:GGDEF domain-containing protein [Lachnospiraceae bacterium]
MIYQTVPYEKRLKDNIKNYALSNLYDSGMLKEYFEDLAELLQINILLTDRHGEKEIVVGDSFLGFHPDVVNEPGRKLRVQNRTVGHLYIKELEPGKNGQLLNSVIDKALIILERLGEETYLHRESNIYLEELEAKLQEKRRVSNQQEKEDVLTGVFNKTYFESRMSVIDRSEVVPVAVINVNINDWKFVNDHFGDEESDRLIKIVAGILKEEGKPEFVIGRIDGDVFGVLIPMAADGEAEEFTFRVQQRCNAYVDPVLAPSVAVGYVYKTNVEEKLEDRMSDAEYEMFNNKFEVKNTSGYRERLEKGISK